MNLFAYFKCGVSVIPLVITSCGLSPRAMFWLNNRSAFIFIPILHGVILPMMMEVPPAHKEVARRTQFYVRRPGLPCPRRDFEVSQPTPPSSTSVPPAGPVRLVSEMPAGLVIWRNETGSTVYCRNCNLGPMENMTSIASSSIQASSMSSSSMHAPSMPSSNMHACIMPSISVHESSMPSSSSQAYSIPSSSSQTSIMPSISMLTSSMPSSRSHTSSMSSSIVKTSRMPLTSMASSSSHHFGPPTVSD